MCVLTGLLLTVSVALFPSLPLLGWGTAVAAGVPDSLEAIPLTKSLAEVIPGYAEVEDALARQRWERALDELSSIPAESVPEEHAVWKEWVLAVVLYRLERFEESLGLLLGLKGRIPVIEHWRTYYTGFAYEALGRIPEALEQWDALPPSSVCAGLVRRRYCGALLRQQEWGRVVECVERLRKEGVPDPEVWVGLAGWKAGQKEYQEAARLAREVLVTSPTSRWGEQAQEIWNGAKASSKEVPRDLSDDERLARGWKLSGVHRHDAALKESAAVRKNHTGWTRHRCEATMLHAWSTARKREQTKSMEFFLEVVNHCPESLTAEFLYRGCDAGHKAGMAEAVDQMAHLLEKRFPTSTMVEDGLLFAARTWARKGDTGRSGRLIQRILKDHAQGDMAADAAWIPVFERFMAGRYKQARALALEYNEVLPPRGDYRTDGRLLYWAGRCCEKLKEKKKAKAHYQDVLVRFPLSWYGLLAYQRLEDMKEGQGVEALAKARSGSVALLPTPSEVDSWGEQLGSASLAAGRTLLSLGLLAEARDELEYASRDFRGDKQGDLLAAWLFHRSGHFTSSHNILRRKVDEFSYAYPVEGDLRWWDVAFPPAWTPLIRRVTEEQGVPWSLAQAITREESGFDPRIESYAHAVGLMQLLVKTASHMAGRTVKKSELANPEFNVTMGVKYVKHLLSRFGHPALAAAGYNSGPGGVARTLERYSGTELDEFVEHIPYDQTRRYTKRVISSAWRYEVLYGGSGDRVVPMSLTFTRPGSGRKP
jgi:soluble lytic murein transglycosylase